MSAGWPLACPNCRAPLGALRAPAVDIDASEQRPTIDCATCGASYPLAEHRVWDLLPPERAARFNAFLNEYTTVRHAEGRTAEDPAFYRALPDVPRNHPLAWQWRIRARSAALLMDTILPTLGPAPRIVDVGAGCGWLTRLLAERGAQALAVDISLDAGDGLGAMRHLDGGAAGWLPRLRADFDRLPLVDGSADLVVFNASLHYSPDIAETLREALRVLALGGGSRLVIMDSPLYRRRASGEAMVAERKAAYQARYGFASDVLGSAEFLVDEELERLGESVGIDWRVRRPWYGLVWALRPVRARLRGRREPARFAVVEGSLRMERAAGG